MLPSQSPSPGQRISKEDRSNSTASITKPSPPGKGKGHRAHLAGHGRVHTRNSSYGKNLNKLTKLADEGDKARSPPTSSGHVKRNSSTTSLPRTGSKVSIRRNTSNVSLKRNSSHAQVQQPHQKAQRPPTPLRKSSSRGKELDKLGQTRGKEMDKLGQPRETKFLLDDGDEDNVDMDEDNDWTEESASQSPSVTRQSSGSKRFTASTEGDLSQLERPNPPDSPPQSPPLAAVKNPKSESSFIEVSHPNHHQSRPPDADAITSRLLARGTSSKPQITSISATDTPGTHTPPTQQSSEQPTQSSLPGDGISRFLGPHSASLSGSAYHLSNALGHPPHRQSSFSGISSERSSPPAGNDADAIRRIRSSGNLGAAGKPTVRLESPGSDSGRAKGGVKSYTFEAGKQRRSNFTQVRMELWRNQTAIEPSHGPPAPMINRLPVSELGVEERRVRQWEEAETQMHHLKRFRNPTVDGARRALKRRTAPREAPSSGSADRLLAMRKRDGSSRQLEPDGGDGARTPGGSNQDGHAPRSHQHQHKHSQHENQHLLTSNRHTPRSVRFEVGLEPGDDLGADETDSSPQQQQDRGLETLLRSLWVGGEMGMGGEE